MGNSADAIKPKPSGEPTLFQKVKANPYARYYFALSVIATLAVVALIVASHFQGPTPTALFENHITQMALGAAAGFFIILLPAGYALYKRGSKPSTAPVVSKSSAPSAIDPLSTKPDGFRISDDPRKSYHYCTFNEASREEYERGLSNGECLLFKEGSQLKIMVRRADGELFIMDRPRDIEIDGQKRLKLSVGNKQDGFEEGWYTPYTTAPIGRQASRSAMGREEPHPDEAPHAVLPSEPALGGYSPALAPLSAVPFQSHDRSPDAPPRAQGLSGPIATPNRLPPAPVMQPPPAFSPPPPPPVYSPVAFAPSQLSAPQPMPMPTPPPPAHAPTDNFSGYASGPISAPVVYSQVSPDSSVAPAPRTAPPSPAPPVASASRPSAPPKSAQSSAIYPKYTKDEAIRLFQNLNEGECFFFTNTDENEDQIIARYQNKWLIASTYKVIRDRRNPTKIQCILRGSGIDATPTFSVVKPEQIEQSIQKPKAAPASKRVDVKLKPSPFRSFEMQACIPKGRFIEHEGQLYFHQNDGNVFMDSVQNKQYYHDRGWAGFNHSAFTQQLTKFRAAQKAQK